jgi:adenylate cyclase
VNMSADKSDEYLSDGMTEELLNRLAQVPGLRVPGRTSSFAFKGKNEDDIFRKIGEQLSVSTVLEGSVRKAGDKLRVTAQLINVADGFHLWSETYDGDMKDILAFQSDVAQRVAQALQMKLGVEETRALAKHPTENPEAHRLYLLGRFDFLKGTEAGWNGASNYYTQAIQLDPNYALAYCGLADNYGWMGGSVLSGREAWAREKVLAQKAVALNPSLADAHLSLGTALVSAFEWREGEREMKRALELNPNLAFAYDNYAWLLTLFGRFDEAIAREHKALDIDPLSPLINSDYGATLMNSRRYDDAIALLRKALKLDPNYAQSHYELGWCLFWKGQPAPAIAEFQLAKKLDDSPTATGSLGYIYAVSGDRAHAEQLLRELEDLSHRRYVTPWAPAVVHLALGEKDQALDWLEKCYADQDGACWSLNIDPVLDGLRNEPRFQALLKKTGLSNPL